MIDKEIYYVEETKLNDFFGLAFNEIVETGNAKETSYDYWLDSFKTYKSMAINGTYSWEVYLDRIVNQSRSGDTRSEADYGMFEGKTAKGNPNKKQNHAARMARLNYTIAKLITNTYTSKKVN